MGVQGKNSGRIMERVTNSTMTMQGSAMRKFLLGLMNSFLKRATCSAMGDPHRLYRQHHWLVVGVLTY